MPVSAPARRPAYPPIGRLRTSPLSGGKKSGFVSLNLTAMVDMFTILVIFLVQIFKATGEVELSERIKVPTSMAGEPLEDQTAVIQVAEASDAPGQFAILLLDNQRISADEMGDPLVDQAGGPIPGLSKKLEEARLFREKIEGRDQTQAFQGSLVIQADIGTDFRLVRRVIGSANEGGWAKIKFVTTPVKSDVAEEGEAAAEG